MPAVGQRGDRDAADEVRREPAHGAQVPAHEAGDLRPLDLDDDLLAGVQPGRVHLGDGRRGDGRLVDPGEDGLQRRAELLLERAAHGAERLGRHAVTQLRNSDTSSGGKIPSPELMIWPILM